MAEYIEREALIKEISESTEPFNTGSVFRAINKQPAADVVPVRHGRCEVCQGKSVITQDCDNGYSIEVDTEQSELAVWYGDNCLAVFSIDYCPNCGAKMDGEDHG